MDEEQEYIPAPSSIDDKRLDPAEVVKFTQRARYHMFDDLTEGGTKLTTHFPETMQLLRDMDGAALTTRKLNIEEKAVADGRATVEAADNLMRLLGGKQDPYKRQADAETPQPVRTRSPIPEVLPPRAIKLAPGEDAQGEQTLSISNYISSEE